VRRFGRRLSDDWRITSYSALIAGRGDLPERPDFDSLAGMPEPLPTEGAEPEPEGVFAFPRGIRAGQCLHGILEEMDFQSGDGPELRRLVRRHLERQGLDPAWEWLVARWILDVLAAPLDAETGLRLNAVAAPDRVAEMGFYLPLSPLRAAQLERLMSDWRGGAGPGLAFGRVQGMLNGFIDLILVHRGRYYLLDYKSNHLGNRYGDYGRERLQAAVREHPYDLQYLIYSVALHRYLQRRLPGYDYRRHFGGVYYLFLRGMGPERGDSGIYRDRPPLELIEALDRLFGAGGEVAA
jgi:exodeoxyribonuclease V beta subunit